MNNPFSAPIEPSRSETFNPYQQFGGYIQNPYLAMGAEMGTAYLHGTTDYVPHGFGAGNFYDAMEQQRQTARWRDTMDSAKPIQSRIFADIGAGIANSFSAGMSPQARESMQKQVDWMMNMAPSELIGNRTVDKLTGGLNVIGMAGQIYGAGQGQIDPVTGFRGTSAGTSGHLANSVFNRFFTKTDDYGETSLDPNYLHNTNGLTAMDMGDLYKSLARRGSFTQSNDVRGSMVEMLNELSPERRNDIARRTGLTAAGSRGSAAGGGKITAEDIDSETLNNLQGDDEVQTRLREISAEKIGKQLEGYSHAVAAVRDAFLGSGAGSPSIEEIVKQLAALGGGATQRLGPMKLAGMMRGVARMAEINDITIEGANQYIGLAQQAVAAAGGSRTLAFDVGMYGMNVRGGFASGQVNIDAGFNSAGVEEHGQFATGRATAAATSPQAKRFGALMRLHERGALTGSMAEAAKKIADGMPIPENLLNMSESEFVSAVSSSSSMSSSMVDSLVTSGSAQHVERFNLTARVANEGQRVELRDNLQERLGQGLTEAVVGDISAGASREDRERHRADVGEAVSDFTKTLMNNPSAADPDKRMEFITEYLTNSDNKGVRSMVDSYKDKFGEDGIKQLALNFDTQLSVSEAEIGEQLGDERGLAMMLQELSPDAIRAGYRNTEDVRLKATFRDAFEGFKDGDAVQRAMAALIENGQPVDVSTEEGRNKVKDVLARSMGMTHEADIGAALATVDRKLTEERTHSQEQLDSGDLTDEEKAVHQARISVIDEMREKGLSIAQLTGAEENMEDAAAAIQEERAGIGTINSDNITITINGEVILQGGSGTAKMNDQSRSGSTVPAGG